MKKFAQSILNNPVSISLAVSKPAENILQAVYQVDENQKLALLEYILNPSRQKEGLIFDFFLFQARRKRDYKRIKRKKGWTWKKCTPI
ncbi:MAG: hypothetical protein HC892_21585 [Saprospiraceae bacterium]|nr:hypothetical protein [Saprospiraceae bacterium]